MKKGKHLLTACIIVAHGTAVAQEPVELELVPWAQISTAIDLTHAGDNRLFVPRQWGGISIVHDSMVVGSPLFMDITSRVLYSGERGLLGMAFDPGYASNGFFYLQYTSNTSTYGTTRISRFSRDAVNPNIGDPNSEHVLLELVQPDPIHQGGGLVFGPDGYLYCGLGDGGGAGDPNGTGQDPSNLFGTIIRIKPEPDSTYSIPPDNPFVDSLNGERPEIWAYGLRNPFRFGIDPLNGDLWIGDVGQQLWEEIDRWPGGDNSGPNFGWSCYEGDSAFNACVPAGPVQWPIVTQAHAINGGSFCAIIGGEVYRGALWPRMQGRFFYTDYCTGGIRTLTPDGNGGYVDQLALPVPFPGMSSIGTDVNGELFITNLSQGRVYKIKDKCPMAPPAILADANDLIATSDAEAYAWFVDGEPFPGGDTQTIYAWLSGDYTVQVTYANGCVKTSEPYFHLSTEVEAVERIAMHAFPQPASAQLQVVLTAGAPARASYRLLDLTGRVVKQERVARGARQLSIDVRDLVSGGYLLELLWADGARIAAQRISVMR
ncbi:MAG: PQQ-dependent sugar dehydrogenase [Flavobacteriales bacterium]|nr:PQQ-dependent sugar dehydrogenase [Flavobacteriales bacterium]